MLESPPQRINPIVFEKLTAKLIKNVGRNAKGAAGPSGLDANAWNRMLTCFKQSSDRLCEALAAVARCLCTDDLSEVDLSAFTAARLIPLDKRPGVRPIAVGEVVRRIICKAIMKVIERDVVLATAPRQVCVGVPSACEAAVHAMESLFGRPEVEGILLVDASNAFNSMNRAAAKHNISRLCPALSGVFNNTYAKPVRLFVTGGGEITSREGTCQGDPLAMAFYAVAITPLIQQLQNECPSTNQCWYADDDGAADKLVLLRRYWDKLVEIGPGFGYFPNAVKTILLPKPEHITEAKHIFAGTGIDIQSEGCRYLGGALGQQEFCSAYIKSMADRWCAQLKELSQIAQTQPQAAYTVFTKGLSAQWKYHIRSIKSQPEHFQALDELIDSCLLPALTGRDFSGPTAERVLLSLPANLGGIAVPIVGRCVDSEYQSSRKVTQPLVDVIAPEHKEHLFSPSTSKANTQVIPPTTPAPHDLPHAMKAIAACRRQLYEERTRRRKDQCEIAKNLEPQLTQQQRFIMSIAGEKGVSSWLTADPSLSTGTVLNKSDFRDAVGIRYGFPLDGIPASCVCGAGMTVDHALTCPSGGYPTARHDELRDVIADVVRCVCVDVETEPQLLPVADESLLGRSVNRSAEARLDIRARGFWTRQQEAFFDIRVTHLKANMLTVSEATKHLVANEREKKRQYGQRVNIIERGAFTPLVFSTSGMAAPECSRFLKDLVAAIVRKNKDLDYSHVMHTLRCKLAFCLLRWNVTCMRGCRASYNRSRNAAFVTECRMSAQH